MKDFSFVDETIDLNRAHAYRLSIQFSLNGFSFSVLDLVRNKYVALKHTDLKDQHTFDQKGDKITAMLDSDPLLQAAYKDCIVLVVSPKSLLMPADLFRQEDVKQYFEFNHDRNELEELHYNYIESIKAYNIFPLPNPVSNAFKKKFGKIRFFHQALPLIEYQMSNSHSEKSRSALSIYEDFIDIAIFNASQLFLYNSFQWTTHDDILYYLLYAYKQLNLDVLQNELYVNGNHENNTELKDLIRQYIKKIKMQKPPSEFTYSYTFKKNEYKKFTNLFRLNLCV
jgi:hypothetical protein